MWNMIFSAYNQSKYTYFVITVVFSVVSVYLRIKLSRAPRKRVTYYIDLLSVACSNRTSQNTEIVKGLKKCFFFVKKYTHNPSPRESFSIPSKNKLI